MATLVYLLSALLGLAGMGYVLGGLGVLLAVVLCLVRAPFAGDMREARRVLRCRAR